MNKEDQIQVNRKLALFVGFKVITVEVSYTDAPRYALLNPAGERESSYIFPTEDEAWENDCPNFFADEIASAQIQTRLIEKGCCIVFDAEGVLITAPPDPVTHIVDELVNFREGWSPEIHRTQIALAALSLIEKEQQ